MFDFSFDLTLVPRVDENVYRVTFIKTQFCGGDREIGLFSIEEREEYIVRTVLEDKSMVLIDSC